MGNLNGAVYLADGEGQLGEIAGRSRSPYPVLIGDPGLKTRVQRFERFAEPSEGAQAATHFVEQPSPIARAKLR